MRIWLALFTVAILVAVAAAGHTLGLSVIMQMGIAFLLLGLLQGLLRAFGPLSGGYVFESIVLQFVQGLTLAVIAVAAAVVSGRLIGPLQTFWLPPAIWTIVSLVLPEREAPERAAWR